MSLVTVAALGSVVWDLKYSSIENCKQMQANVCISETCSTLCKTENE